MKYNYSLLGTGDNPFSSLMIVINEASGGLFTIALLFIIFMVSFYMFSKKTQDTGKSTLMSLHIVTLLALLLFYIGKIEGYVLVTDILMYGLLVGEIVGVSVAYFSRSKGV